MNKLYNNEVISRFLVLQPILDIITSIMINELSLSISISMIIRFLFIIYDIYYLYKNRNKYINGIFIILLIYIITNTIGNYIIKDNFNLFTQAIYLLKYIYYPICLLFFYKYFQNNKELNKKVFIDAALILTLSLIISIISNTSYCSYNGSELIECHTRGYLGWFNSANEISVILVFYFGMMLINFIKSNSKLAIIPLILCGIYMILIGTKTGFIGLFGILITYIIYYLITAIISNKKIIYFKKILVLLILIIGVILYIPHTPLYYNLHLSYEYSQSELTSELPTVILEETPTETTTTSVAVDTVQTPTVTDHLLFNDRISFLNVNKVLYKNSNIFNKLFGITNQNNYIDGIEYNHICERDLFDLIIFYGIIGTIIIISIMIFFMIKIIIIIINNPKILLIDEIAISGIILLFMLAISYLAGHTLFNPAVSIYLAYIINHIIKIGESHE
jgi:hypothetical protein